MQEGTQVKYVGPKVMYLDFGETYTVHGISKLKQKDGDHLIELKTKNGLHVAVYRCNIKTLAEIRKETIDNIINS